MYASRHAVFVGPGRLPQELREVLARRAGALQPDLAIQVPRLLATFDSAVEAERIAAQLQRLRIGAAVAGPEQPPPEAAWSVATSLERPGPEWQVPTTTGETRRLPLAQVERVTVVDWRTAEGPPDRAVLLTVRDERPVLLRASQVDRVSAHSVPAEGLRALTALLEAVALEARPAPTVRSRRLTEADFRAAGALTGDLLPLVVAVIDALDDRPGELPRAAHPTPRAGLDAGAATGLPAAVARAAGGVTFLSSLLPLLYVGLGVTSGSATAVGVGALVGLWALRRHPASPPALRPSVRGAALLDVAALAGAGLAALQGGAVTAAGLAGLPLIALAVLAWRLTGRGAGGPGP